METISTTNEIQTNALNGKASIGYRYQCYNIERNCKTP
jgi:hypothetical protein